MNARARSENKSSSTTIRVSRDLYNYIKNMSIKFNMNMQEVIENAVFQYEKHCFFEELELSYTRLRSNNDSWDKELSERDLFDNTLIDSFEEDEVDWEDLYEEQNEDIEK